MKWWWAVLVGAAALSSCGGGADPVCGNGEVEDGEQCDDGNDVNDDFCTNICVNHLPDTLDVTIQWAFNKEAGALFTTDGCIDMGARMVRVELIGPTTTELVEQCSFRQVVFLDVEPGTYTARLHVTDNMETLLTTGPIEDAFQVGATDVTREVVIGWGDWVNDYTGTFYFRLQWGGLDCSEAGVAEHLLVLEQDGAPLTGFTTDDGDRVDGTQVGACRTIAEEFPQSVAMAPWGPTKFTVIGRDSDGMEQYREVYDTFIGAGASNPEMVFDVNSLTPDAGVPDAGVPDATP